MVAELRQLPERTETMSDQEWEQAKAKFPTARQCERCGRWLYSPASIMRGYGQRCAWLTALEALGEAVPTAKFGEGRSWEKVPVVEFAEVETGHWEAYDAYDRVVGDIRKKGDRYDIFLWNDRVDFDTRLDSAKRRLTRVIENMGLASMRYRDKVGVQLS
jgi:Family of unknown function (DUF6011)